jgi:hypothetical protein
MTENKKAEVTSDKKALDLVIKAAKTTATIRQSVAEKHDAAERRLVIDLAALMQRKSKPLTAATVEKSIREGIAASGDGFRFEYLQPHMAKFLVPVAVLMDTTDTSGKTLAELVTLVRKAAQKIRKTEAVEPKDRAAKLDELLSAASIEQLEALPALEQKPRGSRSKTEAVDSEKWNQAQALGFLRTTADTIGNWWKVKPQIQRGESATQTAEKLRELSNILDELIQKLEA